MCYPAAMASDAYGVTNLKFPELDAVTGISALDLVAFHQTTSGRIKKISAADLGVAPLTAINLASFVTTSGTESWYNVTADSVFITLNANPDDGDLVRVTLDGTNSVLVITNAVGSTHDGTLNGLTSPNLTGDTNSFDLVFALAASEWKIV